jgi:hypothetical protein
MEEVILKELEMVKVLSGLKKRLDIIKDMDLDKDDEKLYKNFVERRAKIVHKALLKSFQTYKIESPTPGQIAETPMPSTNEESSEEDDPDFYGFE